MEPSDLDDLPRAYRIGLRLHALGADDDLIGECLGIDPAGVETLIEIGRRKLESDLRFLPHKFSPSELGPDSPPTPG